MPQRRTNDAQVERLLEAMRSREYRQALARKTADVTTDKLPAKGTDKRRAYDSAMRRYERYVTEGAQKRSFAGASAAVRKPVVVAARRVPLPPPSQVSSLKSQVKSKPLPLPQAPPRPRPAFLPTVEPYEYDDDEEDDFEPSPYRTDLYDLRALLAYYDGDSNEAAQQLAEVSGYGKRLESKMARMLDLAESGVDTLGMEDAGALDDAYKRLVRSLPDDDQDDIEDFNALLHDLPDWQIQMIMEDMQNGETTFSDWMDAWRDSGMDIDADENEYWKLWREAYARAKK